MMHMMNHVEIKYFTILGIDVEMAKYLAKDGIRVV